MTEIILASASPRRIELLQQIGINPKVYPADVDETRRQESAAEYTHRLALEKAIKVAAQFDDNMVVIGADTTVVLDGETFGKPADAAGAETMLSRLSGRTHQVLTAVALVQGNRQLVKLSETDVRFRKLSKDEIQRYWDTGEPRDKAGAYAIQGLGGIFIESISGSYSAVMGLPVFETAALLKDFGVFEF